MGFAESEAGEFLDHLPGFFALLFCEAHHARGFVKFSAQSVVIGRAGILYRRPAHQVGFGQRQAAERLRNLHDLLLINADAPGVAQDGFEGIVRVSEFFFAAKALDEQFLRAIFGGARPNDGQRDGHVLECPRVHHAEHAAHGGRFDLEYAHGAAGSNDVAGCGIVFGDGVEIQFARFGTGRHAVGGDA